MPGLLSIQLQNLDNYFMERSRWTYAINRYTARSGCEKPIREALAAFYSPFKENENLFLEGLRSEFRPILDKQISAVCLYLGIEREILEGEYLL